MMSTNMVSQDVRSINAVAISQTPSVPPSALELPYTPIQIRHDEPEQDVNNPILSSLLTSSACKVKSIAPQMDQQVPAVAMSPAVPPVLPTSTVSIANHKYAVVVARSGGVVTKTFLLPVSSVTPSNQAPQNTCPVVMPSVDKPLSAPSGNIIIQCPARSSGQSSMLSPQTVQLSKPGLSYKPTSIIVKPPTCPMPNAPPPIVKNASNQTVFSIIPQMPTSNVNNTNVLQTLANDLLSVSPMVIAPTAPQTPQGTIVIAPNATQMSQPPIVIVPNATQTSQLPSVITPNIARTSEPPIVIAPNATQTSKTPIVTTPIAAQATQKPIVIAPNAAQTSQTPIVIAPNAAQTSQKPIVIAPNAAQTSQTPIVIAPNAAQTSQTPIVIAPNAAQTSQTPIVITPTTSQKSTPPFVISPTASKQVRTPIIFSPTFKYAGSSPGSFSVTQSFIAHKIPRNYQPQIVEQSDGEKAVTNVNAPIHDSQQEENDGFSGLGTIASVYCEQGQDSSDNELGLRIDSVYSEQDQNSCDSVLGLRIDSVYSEQEQNGVDESRLRRDDVYTDQEESDGANELGLRIGNVVSLAEEDIGAFHDGDSSNIAIAFNTIDTDSNSESSETGSESIAFNTIDTDSDSESTETGSELSFTTTNAHHSEDAYAQTGLTHIPEFHQNTRKKDFEDEIKQILTETSEEETQNSKSHVSTRLEYLPLSADVTCDELPQPETRLDITSEETLDSELERLLPDIIIPDIVTHAASVTHTLSHHPHPSEDHGGIKGNEKHCAPLGKRCVARKRCTQSSRYFQHRNRLSKPIRMCSVLTPKLVVEDDEVQYDVESVPCTCGVRLSDIKKEHARRHRLVNLINHDHTYYGDYMSDLHNTSDISTDSASSSGYHWSSEDEDGGIHVRGEAILEVVTVTPQTLLADRTLKNILWAPIRKKKKKKPKPSPNAISVKQKPPSPLGNFMYAKDVNTSKTFYTSAGNGESQLPTDKVVVGNVQWNVEPKQQELDPVDQEKSLGWILSKDKGSSLYGASQATGPRITFSSMPGWPKQSSPESNLSTENSDNIPGTTIRQETQPTHPKTIFKLVLKRGNDSGWTISGQDNNQDLNHKGCSNSAGSEATRGVVAKEASAKPIGSGNLQSEQTCSTAVIGNVKDKMNGNVPKPLGKVEELGNEQQLPFSSHSNSQDSIFDGPQTNTESKVNGPVFDNKSPNTGMEVISSNECSNYHMVSVSTEEKLEGESAIEVAQASTNKSVEKDCSNLHYGSEIDESSTTLPQEESDTVNQNETGSHRSPSEGTSLDIHRARKRGRPRKYPKGSANKGDKDYSTAGNMTEDCSGTIPQNIGNKSEMGPSDSPSNSIESDVPKGQKPERLRKYSKGTSDELSNEWCEKSSINDETNCNPVILGVRKRRRPRRYTEDSDDETSKPKSVWLTKRNKDNGISVSNDLSSEPSVTMDLSSECKIRVIDVPPEVMGKLGISDDPQSTNQSLVDNLNQILPLISSEKEQIDSASDADAFPSVEDGKGGLPPVIVGPASEKNHSKSAGTENSCSADSSVRSIEHKELNGKENAPAVTEGASTQDIVKQGQTIKSLSRIEQLKAKLKQQEEALQLVRQEREQSKRLLESIDMM